MAILGVVLMEFGDFAMVGRIKTRAEALNAAVEASRAGS